MHYISQNVAISKYIWSPFSDRLYSNLQLVDEREGEHHSSEGAADVQYLFLEVAVVLKQPSQATSAHTGI